MSTRKVLTSFFVIALAAECADALAQRTQRGFVPKAGFVPDATTAQKVAEAILVPVYGKAAMGAERPYRAILKGNIWIVTGSVPCENAPSGASCPGGAAEVHINRRDGKITFVSHGQ